MQVAFAALDLPVRVLERRAVYMRVIDGVSYTAVLLHAGHDRFRAMRIYRGNVSVCVCVHSIRVGRDGDDEDDDIPCL